MDEIKGIARVRFHPGKAEEWNRLSEAVMEIVRTQDSGTAWEGRPERVRAVDYLTG